jgi:heterodisulfide reductase subunit A
MIQCVGARDRTSRPYCSRICCEVAIKNSIVLKEEFPDCRIHILYRDIRTMGKSEALFRKAKEMGVRFIKFSENQQPTVSMKDDKLEVEVYDTTLGKSILLKPDNVVLSTPLVPPMHNRELSKLLKVPTDLNGFFLEAHVKLRPVDFATDGIFLCGTAHSPQDISSSIAQALATASRAAIPMRSGTIKTEAISAQVNEELCVGCETCVLWCEYGAPRIIEKDDGTKIANINEALCKGCGSYVKVADHVFQPVQPERWNKITSLQSRSLHK